RVQPGAGVRACNTAKGTLTAQEFGHLEVQAQATRSLNAAAAVNTTRWALYHHLQATGLPMEAGTGGRTKWHRTVQGLPKAHWLDAACVGASTPERLDAACVGASTPERLGVAGICPLRIRPLDTAPARCVGLTSTASSFATAPGRSATSAFRQE